MVFSSLHGVVTTAMTTPNHHSGLSLRRRGANNTITATTPTVSTGSDELASASTGGGLSLPRLMQMANTYPPSSSPRRGDPKRDARFAASVVHPFKEQHTQLLLLQGVLMLVATVAAFVLVVECLILLPGNLGPTGPGDLVLFSDHTLSDNHMSHLVSVSSASAAISRGTTPGGLARPRRRRFRVRPHYGGLDFDSITEEDFQRRIGEDSYDEYEAIRWAELVNMNQDKDDSPETWHDDELDQPEECRRNKWRSSLYVNCNTLHGLDRIGEMEKLLGSGYYREAWLMKPSGASSDRLVLKELMMPEDWSDIDHRVTPYSLLKVQREAIIMERMHASPRIVNIYGYCGVSILSEFMAQEVAQHIVPGSGHAVRSELDQLPHIRSLNNYTVEEKLDLAIEMAESIADLHGHDGGVIINGDVHPVQYLRTSEGVLKMNDFNNAEIPNWNDEEHMYCKVDRGTWSGVFRSPEEYEGAEIDEKVDVYSMGNNVYTLLTGLWPFYEDGDGDDSYSVIGNKVMHMERPYVDDRYRTRSYIEARLVLIMERMWAHDPEERPDIFEVIQFLRETQVQQQQSALE